MVAVLAARVVAVLVACVVAMLVLARRVAVWVAVY